MTQPSGGADSPDAPSGGPAARAYDAAEGERRALAAVEATGVAYVVTRHGTVSSLQEAAEKRGVRPHDIVKTLVVRRGEDDFLLVLVPGDRRFSWAKLRALLGTNRLSMPDPDGAFAATGYVRGTITPFGSSTAWPVVADRSVLGRQVSLGAGAPGVAVTVSGDDLVRVLEAQVADVADDDLPVDATAGGARG